jgi:hypothetical protein
VQPLALHSLLTCALTAAQQPQTLAYAGVAFSKKQEAAAMAAAAAAATPRRPRADGDGDTFYSPCASPEPGAAAAAAAGPADGAAAATAAAAEAAADLWQEGFGFHLGSLLALGPLFDESQQRPCLARFMQLLLQYHEDTAAAASAALQRLTPQLQRQRLWVPKPGDGSSSGGSSSKAGTGGSSSAAGYVPAERSRLLVLLMGLYHLQMLDEQEARQQEQEWKQAQRQRDEEWGRVHRFERGAQQSKQQQQQQAEEEQQQEAQQQTDGQRQQRKNLRMLRTPSGGAAAAAATGAASQIDPAGKTTDVYRDTGLPRTIINRAVDAAYDMQELLLYCLSPVDELSTRSSSSSSGAHRLQVCGISNALMQDGAMLLAQPLGPGAGLPAGVACDRCSVHTTATSAVRQFTDFGVMEMLTGRAPQPPAAERVCGDCGNAAYFCRDCSVGAPMQQHRASSCGAAASGKGMQQAYSHILDALTAAGGAPGSEAIRAIADGCCSCRACVDVLDDRFDRLLLRWQACPMVLYSGPWALHSTDDQPGAQQQQQQQRESGLLPRALEGPLPLPPVLQAAIACAEAGRFLQRADQSLLHEACAPLRQACTNMSMAAGEETRGALLVACAV